PEHIVAGVALEAALDELTHRWTARGTFVAVWRKAVKDLAALAESTGGRVPAAELADRVDVISSTTYWDVALRLGCNADAQRVDTLDRLRDLSPDSAAGDDLVTEVIRELEAQQPG